MLTYFFLKILNLECKAIFQRKNINKAKTSYNSFILSPITRRQIIRIFRTEFISKLIVHVLNHPVVYDLRHASF